MTKNDHLTISLLKEEILIYLELITIELTEAHNWTDTDGTLSPKYTANANCNVNTARELVDELVDNLTGKFDNERLTEAGEVMDIINNVAQKESERRLKDYMESN
tara:strand:+ start:330 stop:644 length:315 start_codon:yes stop_codon:yes gene_type:complete